MISLVWILAVLQVGTIGLEGGADGYLPGTGFGPHVGVFYNVDFSPSFRISSGAGYWTRRWRQEDGIVQEDCTFSDLSIYEDAMFTKTFFHSLTLGTGAGLSVHFLKNYVKERVHYGSLTITQFYSETENRFGLRWQCLAEVKIGNGLVAVKGGYTLLLGDTYGQNLFYQDGNIRIMNLALAAGLRF